LIYFVIPAQAGIQGQARHKCKAFLALPESVRAVVPISRNYPGSPPARGWRLSGTPYPKGI